MSRREFSKKVKIAAYIRAGGHCEACGADLRVKLVHYDHELADDLGGEPVLENCKVLCVPCHKEKTGKDDVPRIAKGRRIRERNMGIRKKRSLRAWRKFDGSPVYASRER